MRNVLVPLLMVAIPPNAHAKNKHSADTYDKHGCCLSCGYLWCEEKGRCIEEWASCDPGAGDASTCKFSWAGLSWDLSPLRKAAPYYEITDASLTPAKTTHTRSASAKTSPRARKTTKMRGPEGAARGPPAMHTSRAKQHRLRTRHVSGVGSGFVAHALTCRTLPLCVGYPVRSIIGFKNACKSRTTNQTHRGKISTSS